MYLNLCVIHVYLNANVVNETYIQNVPNTTLDTEI